MSIAQNNSREKRLLADGSALARGAKPARGKSCRTIGDLLIKIRIFKCFRQPNQLYNKVSSVGSRLTKKAEPPPTSGVNRDSGTASANGGWLRRLVRPKWTHCLGRFKRQIIWRLPSGPAYGLKLITSQPCSPNLERLASEASLSIAVLNSHCVA